MSEPAIRIPSQPPPLKWAYTATHPKEYPRPPDAITSLPITNSQVLAAIKWCEQFFLAHKRMMNPGSTGKARARVDEDEVMSARLYLHRVLDVYHGGAGMADINDLIPSVWEETVKLAKEAKHYVTVDEASWAAAPAFVKNMRFLFPTDETFREMINRAFDPWINRSKPRLKEDGVHQIADRDLEGRYD